MISLLVLLSGLAILFGLARWSLGPGGRLADGLLVAAVVVLQPIIWWHFLSAWQTRLQLEERALVLGATVVVAWLARRYAPRFRAPRTEASGAAKTLRSQPPASAAATPNASHRAPRPVAGSPPPRAPATASRIFLSYRRDDSADVVGRIYDRLVQRFGDGQVFKDVDSIGLGVDFRQHLREAVGACAVQLVVIGPAWLNATDAAGRRRLDNERDSVRLEVEAALQRNIPVIPVLVRSASVPSEEQLPATLAAVAYRNGLDVRSDPDFHHDMDRLIAGLEGLIGADRSGSER